MALPPIISNLPIIKMLQPRDNAAAAKDNGAAKKAVADTLSISTAAARALKLSGVAEIADAGQARDTAAGTRAILERTNVALGLDPQFG